MINKLQLYLGKEVEAKIRSRFKNIVSGEGVTIPRRAVQAAIDDIFGPPHNQPVERDRAKCGGCGCPMRIYQDKLYLWFLWV